MGWLIGAIAFTGGLWIALSCIEKVKNELQFHIIYLYHNKSDKKEKRIEMGEVISDTQRLVQDAQNILTEMQRNNGKMMELSNKTIDICEKVKIDLNKSEVDKNV